MDTHFKCLHSNDDSACSSSSDFFAKTNEKVDYEANDACVFNDGSIVMDSVLQRVEGNISKYEAAKKKAGKKRHSYTALFKADVINMLKDDFLQDEISEHFCIHQSQVSRWLTKDHDIMKDATLKNRKYFRKGTRAVKYVEL